MNRHVTSGKLPEQNITVVCHIESASVDGFGSAQLGIELSSRKLPWAGFTVMIMMMRMIIMTRR